MHTIRYTLERILSLSLSSGCIVRRERERGRECALASESFASEKEKGRSKGRQNVYERDRESVRKVRGRTSEKAGALRGERSQLVIRSPPTDERAATARDCD